MNKNYIALVVVIAAVVGGLIIIGKMSSTPEEETLTATSTNEASTSTEEVAAPAQFSTVSIAVLDTEGNTTGKSRGCDKVVMVPRQVAPTTMPLTAAMKELFAAETVPTWYHFIGKTNDTLAFDHATVANGVASIYLTGQLSGLSGVCDNPRAAIQIEETALQFPTVSSVKIFLNNSETTLTPSEQ